MKILKYTKCKKNQYTLTLEDNSEVTLYDDIILKYELLLTKEINNLEEILKENQNVANYYLLLKKLSNKMLSVKQAEDFLIKNDCHDLKVIERLKNEGYLNDERYLTCFVNDAINLKLVGPSKITKDLVNLGLKKTDIEKYLMTIDNEIWLKKLEKYINKKISTNHKYSTNNLKQKLYLDLINKGFLKEQITLVMDSCQFSSDEEVLKQEYQKIIHSLKKKYTDQQLNYKIKQKLLAKGYNLSDINKILNEE